MGLAYFEITVLKPAAPLPSDPLDPVITIGFCGEFSDHLGRHPGWNLWSVGYHGDDGRAFREGFSRGDLIGPVYGPGNTVGCGIDYNSAEYLFTLNGKVIGEYIHKLPAVTSKAWSILSN